MTGRPAMVILNSAQSRYPRGNDHWVRATVRAFDQLAGSRHVMLTSSDPLMWDFAVFLAVSHGMHLKHIVPDFDRDRAACLYRDTMTTFCADKTCVEPIYLDSPRSLSRADIWRKRDTKAIQMADVIYPVSVRPGGRLAALLNDAAGDGADIRDTFRMKWQVAGRRSARYDFASSDINPIPSGDWLIHWTRSSPGPWPGESKAAFFKDMLARPDIYVRSARETLARIVTEGVIRASGWKIPAGMPVVSLTENTPETSLTLVRWRKRFVRYTYEPYGVAIRREALEAAGARKVIYATRAGDPGEERWAVQSPGLAADWTRENEWRHPGDIDLTSLDRRDWFLVVPAPSDREYLLHRCCQCAGTVFVLFTP